MSIDKNPDKEFCEGGMRVSFRGSGASCYRQTSETRLIRECFDLHRRCISWGEKGLDVSEINLTKSVPPVLFSAFTFGGKSRLKNVFKVESSKGRH